MIEYPPHIRARRAIVAALVLVLAAGSQLAAQCPSESDLEAVLESIDLELAARTAEYDLDIPREMISTALSKPGSPIVYRNAKLTHGVLVTTQPVEQFWMALNDEDHHTLLERIGLDQSQVVDGTSRGQQRLLFQSFSNYGLERWWLDEMSMNDSLFERSDGRLWELAWEHREDLVDTVTLPLEPDSGVRPIEASHGAWLLVPLSETCTLVECVNWSDPGGALSVTQWVLARKMAGRTMISMATLAREHIPEPHDGASFVRPDGTEIARDAAQAP